jgi:hypothetical protein
LFVAADGERKGSAMNMLAKLALGAMGQLRPKPAQGDATPQIALPAPEKTGGLALMEAIAKRRSGREFSPRELPCQCSRTCCGQRTESAATTAGEPRRRR